MGGRAIVLGAGGFAGQRIVQGLARDGWDVAAVTRRRACPTLGLDHVICDATDRAAIRRAAEGADCIVNATGGSAGAGIRIAHNVAALLRHDVVGHVIHLSSLSVFGQTAGVMTESVQPRPALGHRYANAKLHGERALSLDDAAERRSLILRPGCIYGIGAAIWVDRIARLIQGGRLGTLGARGEGTAPFIHVQDVAAAVRRAASLRECGVRHLIGPEEFSWNAYFARIARLLGVPLRQIGASELAAEVWLGTPLRHGIACARRTGPDTITPTMARLFRSGAIMATERYPFQHGSGFRHIAEALDEALQSFQRSAVHSGVLLAARRQHGVADVA